jgi:hypothetical protein
LNCINAVNTCLYLSSFVYVFCSFLQPLPLRSLSVALLASGTTCALVDTKCKGGLAPVRTLQDVPCVVSRLQKRAFRPDITAYSA